MPEATLYVIPGSHACRTGMLMLEHKGIPYRTVELMTGPHGLGVRLRGFPGNRTPIRSVDGHTHRMLAILDRLGTVPALRYGEERVQRNREIARFLERVRPEPPLFPTDPERLASVQEAEGWGDEALQMAARRIVLAAGARDPDALQNRGAHGRLGPLLSRRAIGRRIANNMAARTFRADPDREQRMLAQLPPMLDRVDAWIAEGVLGAAKLNAADLTIAPSLALLSYRLDLRGELEGRPAWDLMERVVPDAPG